MVFMEWVTLDIGEQALVYDIHGTARIEEGPQRIFLFREKFILLRRYSADQNHYLIIQYKDGRIEHKPGPCWLFKNPMCHKDIRVESGISLDANELVVVYKNNAESQQVERYLQYGPCVFIPKANEWLHEFCWHGTDPDNKTRKVPRSWKFTKLQVIPDQFYYNVDEVRTADHAVMRIKLMMFYELTDIELMLTSTMDPMADFINCLCADVVAFAAKLTYMEFIEKSSELNNLSSYPRLLERCKAIGYSVAKVVYRGYFAWEKLQKLHDSSVEKRTKLKIQFETEEQNQNMVDATLNAEVERAELEQKMALEKLVHDQTMERLQLEHQLKLDVKQKQESTKQMQTEQMAKLQAQCSADEEKLRHYRKLQALDVQMTDYLVAQTPRPAKVVVVKSDPKAPANLHLHHN